MARAFLFTLSLCATLACSIGAAPAGALTWIVPEKPKRLGERSIHAPAGWNGSHWEGTTSEGFPIQYEVSPDGLSSHAGVVITQDCEGAEGSFQGTYLVGGDFDGGFASEIKGARRLDVQVAVGTSVGSGGPATSVTPLFGSRPLPVTPNVFVEFLWRVNEPSVKGKVEVGIRGASPGEWDCQSRSRETGIGVRFTAPAPASARPVYRSNVNLDAVTGTMLVDLPEDNAGFFETTALSQVPRATEVDVTNGSVAITAALATGEVKTGTFYGGRFLIDAVFGDQVVLELSGPKRCTGRRDQLARELAGFAPYRFEIEGSNGASIETLQRGSSFSLAETAMVLQDLCRTGTQGLFKGGPMRWIDLSSPISHCATTRRFCIFPGLARILFPVGL